MSRNDEMQPIQDSLIVDEVRRDSPIPATSDDPENPNQRLCDAMNAGEGTLTGYDCPVCKNKGVNYRLSPDTGSIVAVYCKCKAIREAKKNAQNSGLGDMLERCTMDTYRADLPWQRSALQTVQDFLSSPDGNWLYVGGQVGSGKTHLCAAATGELLRRGIRAKYVIWRTEDQYLRSRTNDQEYNKRMNELARVPVLYIDDFLKIENGEYQRTSTLGAPVPTGAEVRRAFELINARYNLRQSITIFSSEHRLREINAFDSGLASRILERCGKDRFVVGISRSADRNMRYAV